MANVKISALPSYTGTNSDLRWFVIDDSSLLTTYKYSGYTSPFRANTSTGSVISDYMTPSSTGTYSLNIGGTSNSLTTPNYGGIIGGSGNQVTGNQEKVYIINSEGSLADGSSRWSTIISGYYSQIRSGDGNVVLGRNGIINGSNDNGIIGGHAHTISASGEGIIAGGYNNLMSNVNDSGIFAGRGNQLDGGGCCGGNVIIAGESNSINNSPGKNNAIIQGYANNIRSSADFGTIINGESNMISSSNNYNVIIGSKSSTVTGTTSGATMIGTVSRSADRNDCLFVENLKLFNYTNLDFANDSDAAAGGVVLGQVYHSSGTLKIRIT